MQESKEKTLTSTFWRNWYNLSNNERQVIVFPEQTRFTRGMVERTPTKICRYRSIDQCLENLEEDIQVNILFSPKKIAQCANLESMNNDDIQEFIDRWVVKSFNGCNLLVNCHIVWNTPKKKHRRGEKPFKKIQRIEGYLQKM